jgi:CheY-like chemotaxis protein
MSTHTVLVIDDELLVLEAMTVFLEDAGLSVLKAGSGAEGVRMAKEEHPDLILSDYSMPGMDGVAVLQAIRNDEATQDIPFVLFTAHASPALRDTCLDLGADAMLPKGINADELIDAVNRLTNH